MGNVIDERGKKKNLKQNTQKSIKYSIYKSKDF